MFDDGKLKVHIKRDREGDAAQVVFLPPRDPMNESSYVQGDIFSVNF